MYNFLCSLLFAVPMYDLPPELWDKNMVQLALAQLETDLWRFLHSSLTALGKSPSQTGPLSALASAWHAMLTGQPNTPLVQFVIQGICQGFCIGFTRLPGSLKSANKNFERTQQHPDIGNDYLASDQATGFVVGPFPPRAVPHMHISRFRVTKRIMETYCWPVPSQGPQCQQRYFQTLVLSKVHHYRWSHQRDHSVHC